MIIQLKLLQTSVRVMRDVKNQLGSVLDSKLSEPISNFGFEKLREIRG